MTPAQWSQIALTGYDMDCHVFSLDRSFEFAYPDDSSMSFREAYGSQSNQVQQWPKSPRAS